MKRIKTSIEIHGRPRDVWRVLSDTDCYGDWNPFIRSLQGKLQEGGRVRVSLKPPEGKAMTFRPKMLMADEERELRWKGHLLIPGLLDGEHRFAIEPMEKGHVRFVQEERFTGMLVPLLMNAAMRRRTERGFSEMNEALKQQVES
ncbi:SRPBCC domain-containing protein [Candidatus Bipolaricaulota bacterium]|nr:SRPBCC domain-containing protein [Candidatus Bipolaricaulota bacterium]